MMYVMYSHQYKLHCWNWIRPSTRRL